MKSVSKLFQERDASLSSIENYTSDIELLREAIMAEYDATNLYIQMANKARNPDVKKVLEHVAHEEKVHIGEFEELLEKLDPNHDSAEDEGEDELKDMGIDT